MPDNGDVDAQKDPKTTPAPKDNIKFDLESITKLSALIAIVAYAVGLIVVNSYLYSLGVSEFDLFRAKFIATGFLAILIVTTATAGLSTSYWILHNHVGVKAAPPREQFFWVHGSPILGA
jgi:hypothetical protein